MSRPSVASLVQKYRNKGLLIDTNLLLLYFVGHAVPERMPTFKRILNQGFTEQDYAHLCRIISNFSRVVTTPHILTEVSNLSNGLKGESRELYFERIAPLVSQMMEHFEASEKLCYREGFARFGLTDTAIAEAAPDRYLVMTTDAELYGHLQKRKVDAINFNHLRQLSWSR